MESLCQTSQVTPQLLAAPRPLIKRQAETTPSGFLIIDIPRFPEPAHPREDTDPATAERLGLDRRTGLLITYLHLLSEYFLLDGACLRTSAYTLHPYRENSFLIGACPRTFGCTLHPYRENSFLVGACPNISGFALHPYRNNLFLVGAYTNILIFPSIF